MISEDVLLKISFCNQVLKLITQKFKSIYVKKIACVCVHTVGIIYFYFFSLLAGIGIFVGK